MSELAGPLARILADAARLPESGKVERYAERLNPKSSATQRVILVDVSGSMCESVRGTRKIDILRRVLDFPIEPSDRVFAFHSAVEEVPSEKEIPEPVGSTALHLAIQRAIPLEPRLTLVISDGHPDDRNRAIAAAKKLTGQINTIYIGPESDADAIAFMRRLAAEGCGMAEQCDIRRKMNEKRLFGMVQRFLLMPEGGI